MLLLVFFPSACATLGRKSLPERGVGPLSRPDAGAEYDVLVGELAARDGDFEAARGAFERAVAKDPGSAYLAYRLARLAAQLGDLDAAAKQGERALALNPEDEEGRLFLARLYRVERNLPAIERVLRGRDGQPFGEQSALLLYQIYLEIDRLPDALRAAEGVLADDPDNLSAHLAAATVYERMKEWEKAEQLLREGLVAYPDRFVLYSRLARLQRARGDRDGEIAVYRQALQRYPGHYGTLMNLGEAQIAANDLEGAISTYEEIARRYPDDLSATRRLAALEFAAGRYEAAERRLGAALAAHPAHYEFAYSLGQVRRGQGRAAEALAVFESVPKSHPLYVEARLQITALLEERGDLVRALEEIESLRSLRSERELDFHAASLRARTGHLAGGVSLLEAMLKQNPDDEEVLYQLGVLYGLNKNEERALHYMREALKRNPKNPQALNYIGYTWAERGENLDEAEKMLLQAVALSPSDGYIADSLAWIFYMRARPLLATKRRDEGLVLLERARTQLDRAAELTGGDPVVSEHLGDVYLLLEQREQALRYYQQAVQMKYREEEQPELLHKLDRLQRELGVRPLRGTGDRPTPAVGRKRESAPR